MSPTWFLCFDVNFMSFFPSGIWQQRLELAKMYVSLIYICTVLSMYVWCSLGNDQTIFHPNFIYCFEKIPRHTTEKKRHAHTNSLHVLLHIHIISPNIHILIFTSYYAYYAWTCGNIPSIHEYNNYKDDVSMYINSIHCMCLSSYVFSPYALLCTLCGYENVVWKRNLWHHSVSDFVFAQ